MHNNPVGWFEIYVENMPRARKFYESMLSITIEKLADPGPGVAEMFTFPMQKEAAGATGALVRMEQGGPSGNGVIVYFSCADCATECNRAAAHGGRVMKEKFSIGRYGYIALVTDTEGNTIGLHSMK